MKKFLLNLSCALFLIAPSLHASWQNRFAPLADLDTEAAIAPPKKRLRYTKDELTHIRDQMKAQGLDNKPEGYERFPRAIKKRPYHAYRGRGGHRHNHYNRSMARGNYGRNGTVLPSHQEEKKEAKTPKVEAKKSNEKSGEQKKYTPRPQKKKLIWVPKEKVGL
jgi:hypothetical protein